jgi:CheY-like chemotaxis protein
VDPKSLSGRHILVVEDEMMIMMLIEDILVEQGATVAVASNVEQALGLLGTHAFDVASLDVNLNGSKSYPVAEALAARGVPFVFSTGYSDHALNTAFCNRPVLQKPFRPQHLIESLTGLLVS